jgi:hypothetical protein
MAGTLAIHCDSKFKAILEDSNPTLRIAVMPVLLFNDLVSRIKG